VSSASSEAHRDLDFHVFLSNIFHTLDNVPFLIHTKSEAGWQKNLRPKRPYAFTAPLQAGSLRWNGCGSLDRVERRAIGLDLMRVQFGWPIGMPLVRSLKGGLWEVRSSLPTRRIARLILCFHQGDLVVLHGFIKKTRQTPVQDLALAKKRMKEVMK
jgi:phage-related protein